MHDLEDMQIDCKAVSPTLSLTPLSLLPSRALCSGTRPQPPEYLESMCLISNSHMPSPNNHETQATARFIFDKPLNNNGYQFNNLALQNSEVKKPISIRQSVRPCKALADSYD
jgi:hypothetical protein